jgi:hypothetical protein
MQACDPAHWQQDGIAFELQPAPDGRACLLRASAGGHVLQLGGADATQLPANAAPVLRLALDASGLRQRRRDLRL